MEFITKILIVDDEEMIRDLLSAHLSHECSQIFTANNGEEALQLYHQVQPTVIICDLRMPVMNGIECIKKLQLKPDSSTTVIALSGHGDETDIDDCFQFGVSAFLRKPFNAHELKGLIRHAIALQEMLSTLKQTISSPSHTSECLQNNSFASQNQISCINEVNNQLAIISMSLAELSENIQQNGCYQTHDLENHLNGVSTAIEHIQKTLKSCLKRNEL